MKLIQAKTILVTFLMQLGDLVLTTPFLAALRKSAPDAHIVYLIDKKWLAVMKENSDINEILTIDRKGEDRGFVALWRYSKTLRARKFDYLININPSERCSFLAAFSGASYKAGATHGMFKKFFDMPLKLDRSKHAADMYLEILNRLGVGNLSNEGLKIIPVANDLTLVAEFFNSQKIAEEDKLIGFNVGSASATKRWLPERFAAVADHVAQRGYKPVFFGSESELPMVEQTVRHMKTSSYILSTGKLTIGMLTAALGRLDMLVTNDSGPMHVAISQGVPIVALYGPSKPELYGPYKAEKAIIVTGQPPCEGCQKAMKHVCPDMKCMYNISSQQVISAVDDMLAEGRLS